MPLSRAEAKNLKALHTKKGRRLSGSFLAEGVRLLEEAERFRILPERVYWAPSCLSERGTRLVDSFRRASVEMRQISASELGRITNTETAQGLIAVFVIPARESSELDRSHGRNVLVCENISDPGNLGTLIRSAAAFDFNPVLLVGSCAEPYSPKVVRASAGAIFGVKLIETSVAELVSQARQGGFVLIAAAANGTEDISGSLQEQSSGSIMLAIGSEAEGLSEEITSASDRLVRISHADRVESLNAAIAGSILMKECYDRRLPR